MRVSSWKILTSTLCTVATEVENYDENLLDNPVDQSGAQKRYYFENLKISVPQIKLSVFTSSKLPLDLKVRLCATFALTMICLVWYALVPQVVDIPARPFIIPARPFIVILSCHGGKVFL